MIDWILLGIGLLLTVGTGVFVASEFALVNLDRADLESRQARGERRLSLTIAALKITSTHLSSAQLGITLTTLLTGFTMEPALSSLLAQPLSGYGVSRDSIRPVTAILAILLATLISMVLGELVPKNFALALPAATAKLVMPLQTAFTWLFRPVIAVLNGTSNAIIRLFGIEPKEELSGARSAEELASLVRRSAQAGLLEADTATLLGRTFTFSGHDASDVMTPRPRVTAVQRQDSAAAVVQQARETGFSKFPVYDDNLDDIVGVVHVKQAVAVPRARRGEVPVSALQSDVPRVPETMKLDVLLGEIRGRGHQLAVVVDEYGGTAGIVTLEDLVEELVGEVSDEHDRSRAGVVHLAEQVSFPGILRPDELLDRTGIRVPEDGSYDTVAGFFTARLGRLPSVGDAVEIAGGRLVVKRLDGRRIDRLRYVPSPLKTDAATSDLAAGNPKRTGATGESTDGTPSSTADGDVI